MKNRRKFLKNSALLGTGFFIVPRNVLGGPGFISPSDQLNIAAIGAGGKGYDITNKWALVRELLPFVMFIPIKKMF